MNTREMLAWIGAGAKLPEISDVRAEELRMQGVYARREGVAYAQAVLNDMSRMAQGYYLQGWVESDRVEWMLANPVQGPRTDDGFFNIPF